MRWTVSSLGRRHIFLLKLLYCCRSGQRCHSFALTTPQYLREKPENFHHFPIPKPSMSSWPTYHLQQKRLPPLFLSRGNNHQPQEDDNKVFEQLDITQEFDAEALEEMEREQPSEWMVMKELLGINMFTFVLAALIIFFLSMNAILGPGWLGSTLGIQGTGNFEEVSPSLPGALDLNKPEYKL